MKDFHLFRNYDTRCLQTGEIEDHSFEAIFIILVTLLFSKTRFSLLSSKRIFTAPLNGFYNLEPVIHIACIFVEY